MEGWIWEKRTITVPHGEALFPHTITSLPNDTWRRASPCRPMLRHGGGSPWRPDWGPTGAPRKVNGSRDVPVADLSPTLELVDANRPNSSTYSPEKRTGGPPMRAIHWLRQRFLRHHAIASLLLQPDTLYARYEISGPPGGASVALPLALRWRDAPAAILRAAGRVSVRFRRCPAVRGSTRAPGCDLHRIHGGSAQPDCYQPYASHPFSFSTPPHLFVSFVSYNHPPYPHSSH